MKPVNQGKRNDQIQYSYRVVFFSWITLLLYFFYHWAGGWWTAYLISVVLCLMFVYGSGELNKRYDEQTEKYFGNKEIDNGIVD